MFVGISKKKILLWKLQVNREKFIKRSRVIRFSIVELEKQRANICSVLTMPNYGYNTYGTGRGRDFYVGFLKNKNKNNISEIAFLC